MASRDMFKNKGTCILTNTYCGSKWNNSTWNNTDCKSCSVPLIYKEKIMSVKIQNQIKTNDYDSELKKSRMIIYAGLAGVFISLYFMFLFW